MLESVAVMAADFGTLKYRALALLPFVAVMFVAAVVAVNVVKKRQAKAASDALSKDTGLKGGAAQGGDQSASQGWLEQAAREEGRGDPNAWKRAMLPGYFDDEDEASESPSVPPSVDPEPNPNVAPTETPRTPIVGYTPEAVAPRHAGPSLPDMPPVAEDTL